MSLGVLYWVCILIYFVFGVWSSWPTGAQRQEGNLKPIGGSILLLILLVLLGLKAYPIHG